MCVLTSMYMPPDEAIKNKTKKQEIIVEIGRISLTRNYTKLCVCFANHVHATSARSKKEQS